MKVWFTGEDASVVMGMGDQPDARGPFRSLADALHEARSYGVSGTVIIYEAHPVRGVNLTVESKIIEYDI